MDREDSIILAVATGITVLILGMAFVILHDAKWLENPGHIVEVASPSPVYRTEYVPTPVPTIVVRKVVQTVTSPVPQPSPVYIPTIDEACFEALAAADQLQRAVWKDQNTAAAAVNYQMVRADCKF